MTKEELIALVESQKDVYGIKSFSLEPIQNIFYAKVALKRLN